MLTDEVSPVENGPLGKVVGAIVGLSVVSYGLRIISGSSEDSGGEESGGGSSGGSSSGEESSSGEGSSEE